MARSVFISHSIKNQGDEPQRADYDGKEDDFERDHAAWERAPKLVALRTALDAKLRAHDEFEPWLDQRALEPPATWRDGLHFALAQAKAAVLLLDEKALCSDWVLKEATILSWLRAVGVPVVIVPVLIGVRSGELTKRGFGPLKLRDFQAVRVESEDLELPGDPDADDLAVPVVDDDQLDRKDEIVDSIVAALERGFALLPAQAGDGDYGDWIGSLKSNVKNAEDVHLRNILIDLELKEARDLDAAALLKALETPGFGTFDRNEELRRWVAREILLADFDKTAVAMRRLDGVANMDWPCLYGLVQPLQVDAHAATVVVEAHNRRAGERVALVDATGPITATTVAQRAYFGRSLDVLAPTLEGPNTTKQIVDAYLAAVDDVVEPDAAKVEAYTQSRVGPLVAVLDEHLDPEHIEAIVHHDVLKHLTFLVLGTDRRRALSAQIGDAPVMPKPDVELTPGDLRRRMRWLARKAGIRIQGESDDE